VFVVENSSSDQMRREMPTTVALAERYGYATDYSALTHPSLPNYIAMVSGDLHGVDDDAPPSKHPLTGSSVFGRALAADHTAGVYADAMPTPCATENADQYVVRHNPWTYFVEERPQCEQYDVPMTEFAAAVRDGQLPDAGMVVPDVCHDAHNCALKYADRWLDDQLQTVFSGPDWLSGHLAVVVTADEDDDDLVPDTDNRVLTVVIHPSQHGDVVHAPLDHYSLYGLYEDVLGLPHEPAQRGPSMAEAFGLPVTG
jgi:acid phosphatase